MQSNLITETEQLTIDAARTIYLENGSIAFYFPSISELEQEAVIEAQYQAFLDFETYINDYDN